MNSKGSAEAVCGYKCGALPSCAPLAAAFVPAQENAQIDLTKAQEQQTKITTILNTSAQLGQELTMQLICEALELDYDDVKDKLPTPEDDPTAAAKTALNGIVPEGDEV